MSATTLLMIIVVGVVDVHAAAQTGNDAPVTASQWAGAMQGLGATFTELLPYLANPARFADLRNEDVIARLIAETAKTAESMRHAAADFGGAQRPDSDPTLLVVSRLFKTNAENAYLMFRSDEKEYARHRLQATVNYCATCHSRSSEDLSTPLFGGPMRTEGLLPSEKIALALSLRRFDDARATVNSVLGDANMVRTSPLQWMAAARDGLTIAVRLDDSPSAALAIAERVTAAPVPASLRAEGEAWKVAIAAWMAEKTMAEKTPQTTWDRLGLAQSLVAKAQSSEDDGVAEIANLRATALLHSYLRGSAGGVDASEALLLLGQAYEGLASLEMWDLPSLYYEACILTTPHSRVARQCFEHFQRTAFQNYADWAVNTLPLPVAENLFELEELSNPDAVGL